MVVNSTNKLRTFHYPITTKATQDNTVYVYAFNGDIIYALLPSITVMQLYLPTNIITSTIKDTAVYRTEYRVKMLQSSE